MGTRSQLNCGLVPVARHVINMTNSPGRKARNSVVTDVIGRRALGKLIDLINPLFLIKLCDPVMTDFCVKEKIKTPTAIIWGKQDIVTPPSVAKEFHELLPNSNLYWIDKCGHAPMMEHPQKFNTILENWLEARNF